MDQQHTNAWRPSGWARLPWKGFLALLGAAVSMLATIVVLALSDGKPVDLWAVRPAVILSILAAVANAFLSYALYEGVVLAWWVKLAQGASLRDAHDYWAFGTSALASVKAGRHVNKVAIACLLTAVAFVDGPLLQRASTTTTQSITTLASFRALLSTDSFLQNSTAVYMTRAPTVSTITPYFARVIAQYTSREPMPMQSSGCEGACRGTLTGPGWDVRCNSSSSTPYNLTAASTYNGTDGIRSGALFNIGYVVFTFEKYTADRLFFSTMHKPQEGLIGNLTRTTCTLQAATVRYPVSLDGPNSTVTLLPARAGANDTVSLTYLPVETSGMGFFSSALGGFAIAASNIYTSNVTIYYSAPSYRLETEGPMAHTFRTDKHESALTTADMMSWRDPAPDIIATIREMTFRAALAKSEASNSTHIQDTVVGTGEQTVVLAVYESHYLYLAIALGIVVMTTMAILPLFWKWWILGREVSLSPVEVARAFEAPLLGTVHANAKVEDMLDQVGGLKVKYNGVVSAGEAGEERGEFRGLVKVKEGERG